MIWIGRSRFASLLFSLLALAVVIAINSCGSNKFVCHTWNFFVRQQFLNFYNRSKNLKQWAILHSSWVFMIVAIGWFDCPRRWRFVIAGVPYTKFEYRSAADNAQNRRLVESVETVCSRTVSKLSRSHNCFPNSNVLIALLLRWLNISMCLKSVYCFRINLHQVKTRQDQ